MPSNLPKERSGIKPIQDFTHKREKFQKEKSKPKTSKIGNILLKSTKEDDILDLHMLVNKIPMNAIKDLQIIRCINPILYDPVFKKSEYYDVEKETATKQGFVYQNGNTIYLNPNTNFNQLVYVIGFHIYTNLPVNEKEEWKVKTNKTPKDFCNYFRYYIMGRKQDIASESVLAYEYFEEHYKVN